MIRSFLFSILALAYVADGQSLSGEFNISVVNEAGKPLPFVGVVYRRIPAYLPRDLSRSAAPLSGDQSHSGGPVLAPGEVSLHAAGVVDSNGRLAVAGLPAGDYVVCGGTSTEAYLDPCKWATPVHVKLSGGITASASMILKKGVFLNIHVDDPNNVLTETDANMGVASDMTVGVIYGSGAFWPATRVSLRPNGRDYKIVVPAGQPLNAWIWSRHFSLASQAGIALSAEGTKQAFQAVLGVDRDVTVRVTGKLNPDQ